MQVTVLLFGYLREKAGRGRLSVQVPVGATVESLVEWLAREVPLDPALLSRVCPAVNQEYREAGAVLAEGDEVALIPPVSGG